MTNAPATLLETRLLLLDKLGPFGLKPLAVGIVGDSAHRGGYHCGSNRVIYRNGVIDDYSVIESPRDRNGLSLDAAALDVGTFSYKTHNLQTFSAWCVAQCVANAPDTHDIREIIYSPDGKVVKRWDRLKRRSTGDSTHLYHTHFSFFRDSTKRDLGGLFRRYLVHIGLLEGDIMSDYVKYNDNNQGVYRLQYRLNRMGFNVGAVDGKYGDKTAAAVKAFELSINKDFKGDGKSVNAATWTRMDDAYIDQRAQILVSRALSNFKPSPVGDLEFPVNVIINGTMNKA